VKAESVAFKSFRFTGLVGGLYAAANIFDQPQGTLPLLSNFVFTKRGGLMTVDGSHVISAPAAGPGGGPYAPFAAMAQYNPAGVSGPVPVLFGLTLTPAGVATVINLVPLWTGIFGGPYPSAGPVVSAVQFSNSMVFAFGLNVPPYLYDPIANPGLGLVEIANTFQPTTNYPPWLASTAYIATTSKVLGAVGTTSYIWQALNSGVSGASAPAWTATVGSIVQDGAVRWKNKGAASAEGPPGAAFVFNHLNSLWVWGTAPTYQNTGPNAGIDGPDSLRMSDSGNPTSFDPSNQAFIGQGDGQMPQGGATRTQLN
jgi:hypothetical protein